MLIDTHILIWALEGITGSMGPKTKTLVKENFDDFTVSAASLLEIKLKQRRGGLKQTDLMALLELLNKNNLNLLSINPEHALKIPAQNVTTHTDPFDLTLIAQAMHENLPFLTCDAEILKINHPALKLIDGRL